MRKIIHIDMDAFYASVEQRDNEAYRGKPLAVGHAGERGVVAAASYEARRMGIHSAMSSRVAIRKCPGLIFVPARFDVYKTVSNEIMGIFREYTDMVEPLSLDEAYLDVTVNHKNISSAILIAKQIKQKIKQQTGLTASAGISYNKFLAKVASDYNKPDGLFTILPQEGERFVETLAIEDFFGIGKVTAKQMHSLGIKNGLDLKRFSEKELISQFGKAGKIYYLNARGIDNRVVESHRERKSIGAETTFEKDIDSIPLLQQEMAEVAKELIRRISKRDFEGKTLTLKIKFSDFKTITRSKTTDRPINDYNTLFDMATDLLQGIDITPKVRLIGLSIKKNETITEETTIDNSLPIQLRINFEEFKS